jgi:hypothetical protein
MMKTPVKPGFNISTLQDIQMKLLATPNITPKLHNIAYRVMDFSRSFGSLYDQFYLEYNLANEAFTKSTTSDELRGYLTSPKLGVGSSGKDHFTSEYLASDLRHFVNDCCRLLEYLVPLLMIKFPNSGVKQKTRMPSLNFCITYLNRSDLNFDVEYITQLYEVWNDYKHRDTSGIAVSPWKYEGGDVLTPSLILPILVIPTPELNGMKIDDFANVTNNKILEFLNFVV